MSGQDPNRILQVKHPSFHRVEQVLPASSGKISSADRAGEELVPGKENSLVAGEEAAVSRGVTRRMSNLKPDPVEVENFPIDQIGSDFRWRPVAGSTSSEQVLQLPGRVESEIVVVGMDMNGSRGSALDRPRPTHVIDVAMRQK